MMLSLECRESALLCSLVTRVGSDKANTRRSRSVTVLARTAKLGAASETKGELKRQLVRRGLLRERLILRRWRRRWECERMLHSALSLRALAGAVVRPIALLGAGVMEAVVASAPVATTIRLAHRDARSRGREHDRRRGIRSGYSRARVATRVVRWRRYGIRRRRVRDAVRNARHTGAFHRRAARAHAVHGIVANRRWRLVHLHARVRQPRCHGTTRRRIECAKNRGSDARKAAFSLA